MFLIVLILILAIVIIYSSNKENKNEIDNLTGKSKQHDLNILEEEYKREYGDINLDCYKDIHEVDYNKV